MRDYLYDEVSRLGRELSYMPAHLRGGPIRRLLGLLPGLAPDQLYSYETVFHRITRFHAEGDGGRLLSGAGLLRDLGLLLQRLSRTTPLSEGEAEEGVESVEDIASRCRVTLRTVRRWSLEGLPLCWYRFDDGRCALGVRRSALRRFFEARSRRSVHSTARVAESEKSAILERVEVLRKGGGISDAEIVRQVSKESGRSRTTVRRLLRAQREDEARRRCELRGTGGLSESERCALVRRYREGTPVRALAEELGKSSSTVYRILHGALVDQIQGMKIHYVPSPEFAGDEAEKRCLGEEGLFTFPPEATPGMVKAPRGLPPYLRSLYSVPLLSREREKELFRKYNYIKYRMAMLQERVRESGYRARMIERFEELRRAAEQVRRILIRCNLRLVVNVAKRHTGPLMRLMDLVSEGNLCLIRAVECYDYRREARFATYGMWALTKHFARVVPEANYRLTAFVTGREELFTGVGDTRENPVERVEAVAHLRHLLGRATRHLTEREREIIESHYGTNGHAPRTLEEIGRALGLTRERIRQIEVRALGKLRGLLGQEGLEALA